MKKQETGIEKIGMDLVGILVASVKNSQEKLFCDFCCQTIKNFHGKIEEMEKIVGDFPHNDSVKNLKAKYRVVSRFSLENENIEAYKEIAKILVEYGVPYAFELDKLVRFKQS